MPNTLHIKNLEYIKEVNEQEKWFEDILWNDVLRHSLEPGLLQGNQIQIFFPRRERGMHKTDAK